MGEEEIRAALEGHWSASAAGDQDAEHEIYANDAIPMAAGTCSGSEVTPTIPRTRLVASPSFVVPS